MEWYSKEKHLESSHSTTQTGNSCLEWSRWNKSPEVDKNTHEVFKESLGFLKLVAPIKPFFHQPKLAYVVLKMTREFLC